MAIKYLTGVMPHLSGIRGVVRDLRVTENAVRDLGHMATGSGQLNQKSQRPVPRSEIGWLDHPVAGKCLVGRGLRRQHLLPLISGWNLTVTLLGFGTG